MNFLVHQKKVVILKVLIDWGLVIFKVEQYLIPTIILIVLVFILIFNFGLHLIDFILIFIHTDVIIYNFP